MNDLLENSPNIVFFNYLLSYQNQKAAAFAKDKLQENPYTIGYMMLKSWLLVGSYSQKEELGVMRLTENSDFANEIAEIGKLIDVYVSELKQFEAAKPFVLLITGLLTEASQIVDKIAPQKSENISTSLWNSSAILRDWALYMATYFEDRKDFKNEVQMRFVRCKITNAVMGQFRHLVGPDMIGTAKALEKIQLDDRASHFYKAVIVDFQDLIFKFENKKISVEDKIELWSLKEAYHAAIRLKLTDRIKEINDNIEKISRIIES